MFYVYFYRDPITKNIVYIGKGKDKRDISHWEKRNDDHGSNIWFKRYLRKLDRCGQKPIIERYQENLTNVDAYMIEHDLIKEHGRKGVDDEGSLYNRSIGFEHFNVSKLDRDSISKYLDEFTHFNFIPVYDNIKKEICKDYVKNHMGLVALSRKFSIGSGKIKNVLLEMGIEIKTRGAQPGVLNGMAGKKRGPNNYFKGRKHTDETKKKISESIKQKARGIRVRVNDQEFYSLKAAATYVEVSPSTIARYSKSGKKLIKNGNKFSISVV